MLLGNQINWNPSHLQYIFIKLKLPASSVHCSNDSGQELNLQSLDVIVPGLQIEWFCSQYCAPMASLALWKSIILLLWEDISYAPGLKLVWAGLLVIILLWAHFSQYAKCTQLAIWHASKHSYYYSGILMGWVFPLNLNMEYEYNKNCRNAKSNI